MKILIIVLTLLTIRHSALAETKIRCTSQTNYPVKISLFSEKSIPQIQDSEEYYSAKVVVNHSQVYEEQTVNIKVSYFYGPHPTRVNVGIGYEVKLGPVASLKLSYFWNPETPFAGTYINNDGESLAVSCSYENSELN